MIFGIMMAFSSLAVGQSVQVIITQRVPNLPSTVTSYIDDPFRYFDIQLLVSGAGSGGVDVFLDFDFSINNGADDATYIRSRANSHPAAALHLNEGSNFLQRDAVLDQLRGRLDYNIDVSNPLQSLYLTEGNYSLCITPYLWSERTNPNRTSIAIGNPCKSFDICYSGSAPELVSPLAGAQLGLNGMYVLTPARKLTFRWTSVISNCASNNAKFKYQLKVVKVLPQQNYQDAIRLNPPVFSTEVRNNTFVVLDTLLDSKIKLERGALYVAQVQAEQILSGSNLEVMSISNNGKSQLSTFFWGEASEGYDNGGSGDTGDNNDNGPGVVDNGDENGHTTWSVNSRVIDNHDQLAALARDPYFVDWCHDSSTFITLFARFPKERNHVPQNSIKYSSKDGFCMLPDTVPMRVSFMPTRFDSLYSATYELDLFEYVNNLPSTIIRPAVKHMTLRLTDDVVMNKSRAYDTIQVNLDEWKKSMQTGQRYYLRLHNVNQYAYSEFHIQDTTFYVNNIEAETTHDTVQVKRPLDAVVFNSGITFQWGIDSSLFDQVTPAQFTYPVDLSEADVADTNYNKLPTEIPTAVKTETFNVRWQKASGLVYGDTAVYTVTLKELKDKQTLEAGLKNTALVSTQVRYKNFIDPEDTAFYNKMATGKRYILQISTSIDNVSETKYHYVGGKGGSGLPIVFDLDAPTEIKDELDASVTCFASDTAGMNRVPSWSVPMKTMANEKIPVKLGRFKLYMQDGSFSKKDSSYNGEGYVLWNPVGDIQFGVKVSFSKLKINKDTMVISGTAVSSVIDTLGYIKLAGYNDTSSKLAKFDQYSEMANDNLSLIANEMGNDGKEVKKWYEKINKSANVINSTMQGEMTGVTNYGVFTLPLKLGGDLLGDNSDNLTLQVNSMCFTPTTALMSIVGVWSAPSDHIYVPLLATNICTEPHHFISDSVSSVSIVMPKNYDFTLPNGHVFRFKASTDFSKLSEGCYVVFDKKHSYQSFNVTVEYEFGKPNDPANKLIPIDMSTGKPKPGKPVCGRFSTSIVNWEEFVIGISMDPFTIVGMEDYMFSVGGKGIWWDHSESYTPPQITFPEGYHYKDRDVEDWIVQNVKRDDEGYRKWLDTNVYPEERRAALMKDYQDFWDKHANDNWNGVKAVWQGFYIDQFAVFLPPGVSNIFSDQKEATHKRDSAFYIKFSGINNEVKDTVWYETSDYRLYFSAEHMIFDELNGISLNVRAVNMFDAETDKGGGWAFSLDTVGLTVIANHFQNAHICGTVKVPLFKERMGYKCNIGTEDLTFNVKPKTDKLTMEAWRFNMKLDPSSHFTITHRFDSVDDGNPATLFDLTLNGTLGVDLGSDSTVSMSGVKFQNLWIRNYADDATKKEILGKDDTVGFYNYCKNEFKNGGVHDKTMMLGGTWLNLGVWGKASPQKGLGKYSNQREVDQWEREHALVDALLPADTNNKPKENSGNDGGQTGNLGPFSFNLNTFEFFFYDNTGIAELDAADYHKFGINFAGTVGINIGKNDKVGVGGGFKLIANMKIGDEDDFIKIDSASRDCQLDSLELNCDLYGFQAVAKLFYKEDDPIYGNGWMGYMKLNFFDNVEIAAACGFGKTRELNPQRLAKPSQFDTVYSWWFFEGALVSSNGIPLGPVNLKGLGGGFAYNMQLTQSCANVTPTEMRKAGQGKSLTDGMVASTGLTFRPSQDSWVAKAGIAMCVGDETACDMSGIMTLRIVDGHFGGISLMVNAKILAHYNEAADSTDLATINIAAFIDYTNDTAFGQFSFSAAVEGGMNLKNFLDSSDAVTTMVKNNIKVKTESGDDAGFSQLANFVSPSSKNQKLKQEKSNKDKKEEADMKESLDSIYAAQAGNIGGNINLSVPIELYVRNYKNGRVSPHTGDTTEWYFSIGMPADNKRVSFGLDADLVVTQVNMLFSMYFMMGNYFPDSVSIPALPREVRDFLGSDYKPSNGRTFINFGQNGGFTFGVAAAAHIKFNMALFVDVQAYFGFDVALQKTNGRNCNGHPMGKNGYYAQGQVYAMLKGEVGLGLDLGFWEGHVSLAKAGLGAVLQGGGPNPTWAYGLVKFEAELLGGLCKINSNFDIQLGNVCIEGAGNPMANVKLFQGVNPAYTQYAYRKPENRVTPLARGAIVSNMPWNQSITLSVPRTNGLDVDERMFKFVMLTPNMASWQQQWYERRNFAVTQPPAASFTRENFGTKAIPKFTQSTDDPNVYYFEDREGYFTAGQSYQVHLSATAIEYREYAKDATHTFKHKGQNKANDFVIDLTKSDLHSNYTQMYSLAWRDPLYEHDGDKTVRQYFADTTFFFSTGGLPNTLDNQVIFTWPYNGDPLVPYDNFPKESYNKQFITIAMKRDRQDIFNPDELNQLNKRLKIFMLRKGDPNSAAVECQYSYLSNGLGNNGVPTLKIYIPSKFQGSAAREQAFAVQLMTITDDSYETIMAKMAREAEAIAAQTRVTYEQQTGRNVNKVRNANTSGDDLEKQQKRVLKEAYEGMNADTLLNVKKTQLTEYDIFDQGGEKIYTLYYHVSKNSSYKEMLKDYIPELTANASNATYTSSCVTVRGNYNNYAYLFEPWKPNDSKIYATDVTLPAICHLVIDPLETINKGNELVKRHRRLTMRLIELDNAIKKLEYVYSMPDWISGTDRLQLVCSWSNFGLNYRNQLSSEYAWSSIRTAFAGGLVRVNEGTNMPNTAYRMDFDSWKVTNATKATRYNATNTSFNILQSAKRSEGDTVWGIPVFVSVKSNTPKTRIDSSIFYNNTKYQRTYTSGIGYCYNNLGNNATTYSIVDYATPAIIQDIGQMDQFFKDLYDYSYNIMIMTIRNRANNLKYYYKSGRTYTKHNFNHGFAYTVPEVAVYTAYYQAFNWNYRYYWVNKNGANNIRNSAQERDTFASQMYKPVTLATRDASAYGEKVSVWYRNFILFDKFPPTVEDNYGMLATRVFTNQTQKSGQWNIASFYGGYVNKVTYQSLGYSGTQKEWNTNHNATWKLRLWYANIDETESGMQMLGDMIVRINNSIGSTAPVIMVNRKIEDKYATYINKPYNINAYLNTKRRITNKTNFGTSYVTNWRNSHQSDANKNTQSSFLTGSK